MWRYSLFFLHPRATRKKSKQIMFRAVNSAGGQSVEGSRVLPEQGICVTKLTDTAEWTGCWTPVGLRGIFWPPKWESLLKASLTTAQFWQLNTSLRKQIQSTPTRTSVLADTRSWLAPHSEPHSTPEESHSWAGCENTARISQALTNTPAHTWKWWCAASTNSLALFKTKTLQAKREISSGSWDLP